MPCKKWCAEPETCAIDDLVGLCAEVPVVERQHTRISILCADDSDEDTSKRAELEATEDIAHRQT